VDVNGWPGYLMP